MKSFFGKLIKNNTGVSSKNFFLVLLSIIGCIMLMVPVVCLIYEVYKTNTISTDLMGMAAYIGAVTSVFATAGLTKVLGEKNEGRKTKLRKTESEDSED